MNDREAWLEGLTDPRLLHVSKCFSLRMHATLEPELYVGGAQKNHGYKVSASVRSTTAEDKDYSSNVAVMMGG